MTTDTRSNTRTAWFFILPAVLIMLAACLYPVISAVQLGFYDWSMGTPWSQAKWAGWTSFEIVFTDPAMWRSLWTTLKFAAISVSAEMFLGIALALALEGNLRGMAFFRTLFILPMMVAPIAVGLTWRYLFDAQFGLINALLAAFGAALDAVLQVVQPTVEVAPALRGEARERGPDRRLGAEGGHDHADERPLVRERTRGHL